ncbi:glycosyltransferase, partial [Patescibacteria group bacterium]|nr:glycosyltransferase [Patescibacteria group bacterium]
VYNAEQYLSTCIDSVIEQLNDDDEWIVIDDASTDKSLAILSNYKQLQVFANQENLKLPRSLNKAIGLASKKYIARMDADDRCRPDRFDLQQKFLDKHPNIGVVGGWAEIIDKDDNPLGYYKTPSQHYRIKWKMLFSNPMIHPSLMARAEIFIDNPYNENYINSQDYELWSRLMFEKGIKFANIKTPLLEYRVHDKSSTATKDLGKKKLSLGISLNNLKRYIEPKKTESDIYSRFRLGEKISLTDLFLLDIFYLKCFVNFVNKEKLTIVYKLILFIDLLRSYKFSFREYLKKLIRRKQA